MRDPAHGPGPLADREIVTGGPIDDPSAAAPGTDRLTEPTTPRPDAQPLTNPDGTPDVLPPEEIAAPPAALPDPASGTPQDESAHVLSGLLETGRDNIREGRGDTQANPALAEGGDNG